MDENLLRNVIREMLGEGGHRGLGMGAFAAAPTDLDPGRKPDLGDSSLKDFLDEIDLVDEDEDELYPDTNEFSAVGGGAAGGTQIRGYTLPMGGKNGGKRKSSPRSVKGQKTTHG